MKHKLFARITLLALALAIGCAGIFSYADAKTKSGKAKFVSAKKAEIIKPQPKKKKKKKKKPAAFKPKPLPPRSEEPTIVIIPNQPLIAPPKSTDGILTHDGVIAWTNIQRRDNGGLAALSGDVRLDEIALLRLKDMFAKQYFAHNSPDTNAGASDLAKDVGYSYLLIGENIALGDFGTDEKLVQAWMDSPHHRENILKSGYTEIGIAVGTGNYKGEHTWIAVQIFGRPLSDCPAINAELKAAIDTIERAIDANNRELAARKAELDSLHPKTQSDVDSYNAKVRAYTALVAETNTLVTRVKNMITSYNAQVKVFNACVQS